MFRYVCSNGMVVSEHLVADQRVRHSGEVVGEVIEGVYRVVEETPKVAEAIDDFKRLRLEDDEQRAFAKAAMALRWDKPEQFRPEQATRARRAEDVGDDL